MELTQCIKIGNAWCRKPNQCNKMGNACIKISDARIKIANSILYCISTGYDSSQCIKIWNDSFSAL